MLEDLVMQHVTHIDLRMCELLTPTTAKMPMLGNAALLV